MLGSVRGERESDRDREKVHVAMANESREQGEKGREMRKCRTRECKTRE